MENLVTRAFTEIPDNSRASENGVNTNFTAPDYFLLGTLFLAAGITTIINYKRDFLKRDTLQPFSRITRYN